MNFKEFKRQWKLLTIQDKYINQMIDELKEYVKHSKDNPIDMLFEVNNRLELIEEFSEEFIPQGE